MKKTTNDLMWSLSLLIIGIVTIIFASVKHFGIELPDAAVRILGVVDLISLPVLAYSTVIKMKKNKK